MGLRSAVLVLVATAGCRQLLGLDDLPPGPPDAAIDAPDAGPCQELGAMCASPDTLRTCTMIGQPPVDAECNWGCSDTGSSHCAVLVPAGGGVVPGDLALTGLGSITIGGGTIADDGSIGGVRGAGTGAMNGIEFHLANNVAVYTFDSLTIAPGSVQMRGTHPIALVAIHDLTVQAGAAVDARGDCIGTDSGPGGSAGGMPGADAPGMGGGAGGTETGGNNTSGGGGGGNGGIGGKGGKSAQIANNPAGGAAFGGPAITTLIGGGGGGGGGAINGGTGGGGGGAIQLVANQTITVAGTINAGGCGGRRGGGANNAGGGGGGAGGTILVEAHDLVLTGFLAVNGGGGGGGAGGPDGADATPNGLRAQGADGTGRGGATNFLDGEAGLDKSQTGNGGGGGVGRIRLETRSGTISLTGSGSSPTIAEMPTTATVDRAPTQ